MFSIEVLSKFPRKMSHLGLMGSDVLGNIVDLQICSWACHSSARLPCASFGGDPSFYWDGVKDTASHNLQCLLYNQELVQLIWMIKTVLCMWLPWHSMKFWFCTASFVTYELLPIILYNTPWGHTSCSSAGSSQRSPTSGCFFPWTSSWTRLACLVLAGWLFSCSTSSLALLLNIRHWCMH